MSQHYIAILVPEDTGGWTVLFPDLPGCATHGPSVHQAIVTAADVASAWLVAARESGDTTPAPRSYEEIRGDDAWALDRGVDWSTAVISLVQVDHRQ